MVVRADVQLFKDQVNNILAKANHPMHSGGCAHLLDTKDRYCGRVGDTSATLPIITDRQGMPKSLVTSNVEWEQYELLTNVFNLETHCRDEAMKIICNRYPTIMSQLNTEYDTLPLDLTLQAAFEHIMKNITDVFTTKEEYVKTHADLLQLSFQASDRDGLLNYLIAVTKAMRRMAVLGC